MSPSVGVSADGSPDTPVASVEPEGEVPPGSVTIVPARLRIPPTSGLRAVDAAVVPGGTVTAWNHWLRKEVSTFAVTDPRTQEGLATVTWWSDGPPVGGLGAGGELSVLLGHNSGRGVGAFDQVSEMPLGSMVEVEDAQGGSTRLVVLDIRRGLPKEDAEALVTTLATPPPDAISALVTCTGDLRAVDGARSHADNTVVFLGRAEGPPGRP